MMYLSVQPNGDQMAEEQIGTTKAESLRSNVKRSMFNIDPSTPDAVAISVRKISKMYPLYAKASDRMNQYLWSALYKFLPSKPREFYQEFWALRDISFEVKKGETVGIIGRNGSGKSTLLQIIAGIVTPTQGEVHLNGRVAALLELGSGFNPRFTGRENVYLNGAIWGLTQAEISNIFDDIAAFADIGQYIDQPVRVYSSGMFVRLAFAVQAFVPKQIFVVDEALAVGDEAFQRKCMAALQRFRENGGTVLLVSHDVPTIVRQCNRCLLLHQGQLITAGRSKPVADWYQKLMYSDSQQTVKILNSLRQQGLQREPNHPQVEPQVKDMVGIKDDESQTTNHKQQTTDAEPVDWFDRNMLSTNNEVTYGRGDAEIIDYGMYNQHETQVNVLVTGRRYRWQYKVRFEQDAYNVHFGMMLKTVDGLDVAGISSDREGVFFDHIPAMTVAEVTFSIKLNVMPGTYFLNVGVYGNVNGEFTYLTRRVDICMIRILPCDSRETYGLAYLEPRFNYVFKSQDSSVSDQGGTS